MPSTASKVARLQQIIGRLDDALSEFGEAVPTGEEAETSDVHVVVGTSKMARDNPLLIERITRMVNGAYLEANRELLPPGTDRYNRVSDDDVQNRLAMGDAGPHANRVLHLAYRGDTLVGCCSSTIQPPWTQEGCGHWGLVVVDKPAQGTGVASALVQAAECRLAGQCAQIQVRCEM